MPPAGAEPVNSVDCVANIATPMLVTSNILSDPRVRRNDAVPVVTLPVTLPIAMYDDIPTDADAALDVSERIASDAVIS